MLPLQSQIGNEELADDSFAWLGFLNFIVTLTWTTNHSWIYFRMLLGYIKNQFIISQTTLTHRELIQLL